MRTLVAYLAAAIGAVAAAGCGLEPGELVVRTASSDVPDDGFPCEVRAVLQANCAQCHAGNMYVVPFNTRAMWLGRRGDGLTTGQYAAMLVATGMMPPPTAARQPTAGERAILIDWVEAGMPPGACAPLTPTDVP